MNRKYLHLYNLLLKEFQVPEDKAKEIIRHSSCAYLPDNACTIFILSISNCCSQITNENRK